MDTYRLMVTLTFGTAFETRNSYDFGVTAGTPVSDPQFQDLLARAAEAYVAINMDYITLTSLAIYTTSYDPTELKWKRAPEAEIFDEPGTAGNRGVDDDLLPMGMGIYLRERAWPPKRGRPGRVILKPGMREKDVTATSTGIRWAYDMSAGSTLSVVQSTYWGPAPDPTGSGFTRFLSPDGLMFSDRPTLISLAALQDGSHGHDLVRGYTFRWIEKYRSPTPVT